jgi:hypothetical protein
MDMTRGARTTQTEVRARAQAQLRVSPARHGGAAAAQGLGREGSAGRSLCVYGSLSTLILVAAFDDESQVPQYENINLRYNQMVSGRLCMWKSDPLHAHRHVSICRQVCEVEYLAMANSDLEKYHKVRCGLSASTM